MKKSVAKVLFLAASFGFLNSTAVAQSSLALKICSNTTKGTLVVRVKCKKGETALTPTSFTGPIGATGSTGATGARGASAFDAIPSGTTVYGVIGNDGEEAGGGGNDWYGFSSLPAITSKVLTNEDILISNSDNLDNDCVTGAACLSSDELTTASQCSGTALTPTAPAGKVCIYVTALSSSNINAGTVQARILPQTGTPTITSGFMIGWIANANGDTFLRGVWAYTAP